MLQDALFSSTPTAILTSPPDPAAKTGTTGILLDNVVFSGVTNAVIDSSNHVWLSGTVGVVDTWTMGRTYFTPSNGSYTFGQSFSTPRTAVLTAAKNTLSGSLPKNQYLTIPKPQYETFSASNVVQMKWFAKGMFRIRLASISRATEPYANTVVT